MSCMYKISNTFLFVHDILVFNFILINDHNNIIFVLLNTTQFTDDLFLLKIYIKNILYTKMNYLKLKLINMKLLSCALNIVELFKNY